MPKQRQNVQYWGEMKKSGHLRGYWLKSWSSGQMAWCSHVQGGRRKFSPSFERPICFLYSFSPGLWSTGYTNVLWNSSEYCVSRLLPIHSSEIMQLSCLQPQAQTLPLEFDFVSLYCATSSPQREPCFVGIQLSGYQHSGV